MVRCCMESMRLLDGVVVKLTTWGSRLSIVSIATLVAVLASNCGAETDTGEGGSGGGFWTPGGSGSGVVCGGQECPATKCVVNIHCGGDDGTLCLGDQIANWNDENACTVDTCDDATGEVTHTPYTAEDLDDGDDCTLDSCDPLWGPKHSNIFCESA